jgi:hypothetical protein
LSPDNLFWILDIRSAVTANIFWFFASCMWYFDDAKKDVTILMIWGRHRIIDTMSQCTEERGSSQLRYFLMIVLNWGIFYWCLINSNRTSHRVFSETHKFRIWIRRLSLEKSRFAILSYWKFIGMWSLRYNSSFSRFFFRGSQSRGMISCVFCIALSVYYIVVFAGSLQVCRLFVTFWIFLNYYFLEFAWSRMCRFSSPLACVLG